MTAGHNIYAYFSLTHNSLLSYSVPPRNKLPINLRFNSQGFFESMQNRTEKNIFHGEYWDTIAAESPSKKKETLWRAHMKELYQGLLDRWSEQARPIRILKTDLYEEAVSAHNLFPFLGSRCEHIIGVDVSYDMARAAKKRMGEEYRKAQTIAVSDARNQAFKSNVFDEVISNSTLDHFSDKQDILVSLRELQRILKVGGGLIITLDNPWNPVVFLRNRLPYRALKSLGVIPYYMGVTCSKSELLRVLQSNGFRVVASTAIVHSPRIFAIWIGKILGEIGSERVRACFHRLLRVFELLEKLPTKYVTGYYVSVKAVKRRR